jgi:hypothetical protein
MNVTARVGSNTRGLQSDLHNFGAFHKEEEGKAFSLTSARAPTCPADGVIWQMVKNTREMKMPAFQGVKETDNDYCNVL